MEFRLLNAHCKFMMIMLWHKEKIFRDRLEDGFFWYDDIRMSSEMSLSVSTVKRCRKFLKENDFIDVIVGKFRHDCTKYKVLYHYVKNKVVKEEQKVVTRTPLIQQEGVHIDPINKETYLNKDKDNKEIVSSAIPVEVKSVSHPVTMSEPVQTVLPIIPTTSTSLPTSSMQDSNSDYIRPILTPCRYPNTSGYPLLGYGKNDTGFTVYVDVSYEEMKASYPDGCSIGEFGGISRFSFGDPNVNGRRYYSKPYLYKSACVPAVNKVESLPMQTEHLHGPYSKGIAIDTTATALMAPVETKVKRLRSIEDIRREHPDAFATSLLNDGKWGYRAHWKDASQEDGLSHEECL